MNRLPPEEFKQIFSKVPRLCVDVFITNNDGHVLLTRRAIPAGVGLWHVPGGSVLYGETLEQAVKRVAKYELGVEVDFLSMINRPVQFVGSPNANGGHAVSLSFSCKIVGGEIKLNEEATEYAYFDAMPEDALEEQKEWFNQI